MADARLARKLEDLKDALVRPGSPGPTLAVVVERMGLAAATVTPATEASTRTRVALAEAYERMTGEQAPF